MTAKDCARACPCETGRSAATTFGAGVKVGAGALGSGVEGKAGFYVIGDGDSQSNAGDVGTGVEFEGSGANMSFVPSLGDPGQSERAFTCWWPLCARRFAQVTSAGVLHLAALPQNSDGNLSISVAKLRCAVWSAMTLEQPTKFLVGYGDLSEEEYLL